MNDDSVVMLDEVHERTLNTDTALGLLRKVQRRRPDLRLVVSSASMDAAAFKAYFEFTFILIISLCCKLCTSNTEIH